MANDPTTDLEPAAPSGAAEIAIKTPLKRVRNFRQILLWPLQLMPVREDAQIQNHWEWLERPETRGVWARVDDEFGCDPEDFQERHYREFVSFLPHVQSYLYGATRKRAKPVGSAPVHVYRRVDVRRVRVALAPGRPAIVFDVAHVDLYFFYDIDVVILAVEIAADDLPLDLVEETLHRAGRAYPAGWTESGEAANCFHRVEWLAADGAVLAASDYADRRRYLAYVCEHRTACVAAHWEFLLRPLVPDHASDPGPLRYRHLEYYRMPLMAYLALNDAHCLERADYVRLALRTGPGEGLPYSSRFLADFEARFCYDRFHDDAPGARALDTRFLTSGHTFVVVGSATEPFFVNPERGLLGQFRHQYFMLFLIAHFQHAALLMLSDRLVGAVMRLDIESPPSVRRFRAAVRRSLEIFLRFTHRYYSHEISLQAQSRDLFRAMTAHLGTAELHEEVRSEIQDMGHYLDGDALRRQSNTMVRLTVVTILGLIGTTTGGFLGMNLYDAASADDLVKVAYFMAVLIPVVILMAVSILRARRLSDFLDALSDERVSGRRKLAAFWRVFRMDGRGRTTEGR